MYTTGQRAKRDDGKQVLKSVGGQKDPTGASLSSFSRVCRYGEEIRSFTQDIQKAQVNIC